jgi:quercetin dioxygenase-like cupin family protein
VPRPRQQPVGDLIRRLRERRGLSLRGLASAAAFSPSFLSQVENGHVSPSIDSMGRITAALGLTLGEFFTTVADGKHGLVVRRAARTEVPGGWSHATVESLSPHRRGRMCEPVLVTLAPGGRSGRHAATPAREEFAYVVEGEVDLTLGPETVRLAAGDAVTILRGEHRRWANAADQPAVILIVAVP